MTEDHTPPIMPRIALQFMRRDDTSSERTRSGNVSRMLSATIVLLAWAAAPTVSSDVPDLKAEVIAVTAQEHGLHLEFRIISDGDNAIDVSSLFAANRAEIAEASRSPAVSRREAEVPPSSRRRRCPASAVAA